MKKSPKKQRRSRRAPPAAASAVAEVTIEALGAQGDGVATWQDRRLYVPGTAPGDRARVSVGLKRGDGYEAVVLSLLEPAPGRIVPFCPFFGACGGCAVQHVPAETYAAWKRGILVAALRRRGFAESVVGPLATVPPRSRRRVELSFERRGGDVRLGFNARFSHRVVDVESCALLLPELDRLIGPLRRLAADIGWAAGQALLTRAETGTDVLLTVAASPGLEEREKLAAFAEGHDLARLAWRGAETATPEPLAWRRHVRITLGGAAVEMPPGAFLQPSAAGESLLLGLVAEGVAGAKRIADLYCGLGTFALPLAREALVHAVDSVPAQVAALETAAGRAGLGGRILAEVRDLDRRPLTALDLGATDAVVFDPPRAGALAQAEALVAAVAVKRVVAVSCNPSTLARDLRALVDGGFTLARAVPIDQFPHAAHVEAVAFLSR